MLFPCPYCGNQIENDGSFSGRQVSCPHCQRTFVMPPVAAVSTSGPPPRIEARPSVNIPPMQDASPQVNVGNYSTAVANRFKPANSIFDAIFDFGFKRYVTPLIVRFTWALAVIMAMLSILFILYGTISSYMPEKNPERPQMRLDVSRLDSTMNSGTMRVVSDLFKTTIIIGTILCSLLWIRVALESVIVIFHMAQSMASIDEKTKRLK